MGRGPYARAPFSCQPGSAARFCHAKGREEHARGLSSVMQMQPRASAGGLGQKSLDRGAVFGAGIADRLRLAAKGKDLIGAAFLWLLIKNPAAAFKPAVA